MKNQSEFQFQPERLELLAKRLKSLNVKPAIRAVESDSNLFLFDNQLVGRFPMFFGVVSLLPKIWPAEWAVTAESKYYCKQYPNSDIVEALMKFFSLEFSMVGHIFIPGAQNINLYGGKMLTKYSSTVDMAENIREFISSQHFAMELLKKVNVLISKN